MTIDKRTALIAGLVLMLALAIGERFALVAQMDFIRENTMSKAEAEELIRISERLVSANEACLSIHRNAQQTVMKSLLGPGTAENDQVLDKILGNGSGVRDVRGSARGGPPN